MKRTMRKQLPYKLALLLIGALAFAACGGDGDSDSADGGASGDGDYQVYALLPQGNDQPYGTTYLPPMEAKAKELGIELTITNSQYDADKQASECEVAVAAKPDLIILWPAIGDTVRPCLEAAKDAGIPVTATNSDVNPEDKDLIRGYSGPDTYGQGKASAEIMCDQAGGADIGIIVVNGLTGNSTAINRRDGFVEHVEGNCPNISILAEQPTRWWLARSMP